LLDTAMPPLHLADARMMVRAATVLGWDGPVVDGMPLFGHRVAVAAEVDHRAHEQRVASGWGPVTDRMSIAMWEWPEHRESIPPTVVTVRGVMARSTRWQRAMTAASGFVGFGSTAIVVEQGHAVNDHCLVTAHHYGVAVVRVAPILETEPELVQAGRVGPVETARPSSLSRWVEELVYARLLDDGILTTVTESMAAGTPAGRG
jgi:hypothetical protein